MPILLLLGGTAGGIAIGWFFFRCKHFGNGNGNGAQLPDSETSPAGQPALIGDANHSPLDYEPPGELYGRKTNAAAEKPWFSGVELFDPSYKGPPVL